MMVFAVVVDVVIVVVVMVVVSVDMEGAAQPSQASS